MSDKAYDVPAEWAKRAWVNAAKYEEMYKRSVTDPEGFWAEHGKRIDWFKPFSKVKNTSFDAKNVSIKWFEDGVTNVAHNCIDRHLPKRANQTAIIWEGDDPSKSAHITYAELAHRVGLFANVLKAHGVKKGDRVTIYLPMIPETAYAMLACARIGAIHSVVFGGFSPEAIAGRIADAKSDVVITADEGLRGGRKVPLKANVDAAIAEAARHVAVACALLDQGTALPGPDAQERWNDYRLALPAGAGPGVQQLAGTIAERPGRVSCQVPVLRGRVQPNTSGFDALTERGQGFACVP